MNSVKPVGPSRVKWTRREKGSYVAIVNGRRYAIVNMKSGGPNELRWQGQIPSWEVRVDGVGHYDVYSTTLNTFWTFGDAKQYVWEREFGHFIP